MDIGEFKKVIINNGDSNRSLAKALNMSESTFSSKLHENGASFRKREIQFIIDRYNLTAIQIKNIFFD